MKRKKLIIAVFSVILAVCLVVGMIGCSTPDNGENADNHVCKHVCQTCGNCTDLNCTDKACTDKCKGHEPQHTSHVFVDGKCECGEYEDSEAGQTAKYIDTLEASVMKYINSSVFKSQLVSQTTNARLPLMYLKYVKGSLFSEEQMSQITNYLDMLKTLKDDSGYIRETLWEKSSAKKQGWGSIIDYLFSWSSMYNQYLQYCHANNITSEYDADVQVVLAYIHSMNVWYENYADSTYYLARWEAEEEAQKNGELAYADRTISARPSGMFSTSSKMYNYNCGPKTFVTSGMYNHVLKGVAKAIEGVGGAGTFETWKKSKWLYNYNTLCELFPDKKAAMDDWFAQACEILGNWDREAYGPLYQNVNWTETYNSVLVDLSDNFVKIFEPGTKAAFGFGAVDSMLLTAYNLGADINEYASYAVKAKLARYEKDEEGNYTKDSVMPNWVGFTSSPLVASVIKDVEGFDVNYEKSVQYYFPDHDTGMSGVKPEERVTLDRLATDPSLMNMSSSSGASADPQFMWLTAMAMGIDLIHYVPSTGGEPVNMIEMWLNSLLKTPDGLYSITTNQNAAMMIGYLCQLKGIEAPSPMGMWSVASETIG